MVVSVRMRRMVLVYLINLFLIINIVYHSPPFVTCSSSSFSSYYNNDNSSISSMSCHPEESSSLLGFKTSMSTYSYPDPLRSWKKGTDCCEWDGIRCDSTSHHVVVLDISDKALFGTLNSNSTLFQLGHLRHLDLSNNDFSHSLISPKFCSSFPNLKLLDLSSSNFSGEIPDEISHLSKMQSLSLSAFSNGLVKMKMSTFYNIIGNMTHLTRLDLSRVNIDSTIPTSLTNLSSLISLDLSECNLRGELSPNVLSLPLLQDIRLNGNHDLHGNFPLSNWSTVLEVIDLSNVNFSAKLPSFSVLSEPNKLSTLKLRGCNLYDRIPDWVCNIFIGYRTSTMPKSLGNLILLNSLDLSSNKLSGKIPEELTRLSSLGVFNVSENQLEGPIPHDNHFETFPVDSYKGNVGLCGFPLPDCGEHPKPKPQPSESDNKEEGMGMMLEWEAVMMGCGFGTFVSFAWGCYMLSIGRPLWLLKLLLVLVALLEKDLFGRRRR